jgi:hypothetical protein
MERILGGIRAPLSVQSRRRSRLNKLFLGTLSIGSTTNKITLPPLPRTAAAAPVIANDKSCDTITNCDPCSSELRKKEIHPDDGGFNNVQREHLAGSLIAPRGIDKRIRERCPGKHVFFHNDRDTSSKQARTAHTVRAINNYRS